MKIVNALPALALNPFLVSPAPQPVTYSTKDVAIEGFDNVMRKESLLNRNWQTLSDLSYCGLKYSFKYPLVLSIDQVEDGYSLEEEKYGIFCFETTEEDLFDSLGAEIDYIYREIASDDDCNLASDAIKLKRMFLNNVTVQVIEE